MLIFIQRMPTEISNSGYVESKALYFCLYCKKIIKRRSTYKNNKNKYKSCGCIKNKLAAESVTKHGDSKKDNKKRLYNIWCHMKSRCNNKNNYGYKWYGEKNIKVCKQWEKNYIKFKIWSLLNGYKDDLTIDRIDNDKGYNPTNCRWVTRKEQARNKKCIKLNINKVNKIKKLYNKNISIYLLSKIYNVSKSNINNTIHNRIWK